VEEQEYIEIYGAREHNLKNIDVTIPRNQLVVITGVSGSGKSSLAFDTIYAEGQRRYMESFSAYARSFIGNMERPDVDKIEGLSPVISIEQKTTSKNPRSTVGTTTEIYDFLRLFFARAGEAYSYVTNEKMIKRSEDEIINTIVKKHDGEIVLILAPVVKGRKGHYRELFVQIRKMGYVRVRVDGEVMELTPKMQLDRYKTHDIEIVIDRVCVDGPERFRISESVKAAIKQGKGVLSILDEKEGINHYSKFLMCPTSGIAYEEPAPNSFSFNSPYGACPECNGLGIVEEINESSIIVSKELSVSQGAIGPIGDYRSVWIFREIENLFKSYSEDIKTALNKLDKELYQILFYGGDYVIKKKSDATGLTSRKEETFEGLVPFLTRHFHSGDEKLNKNIKEFLEVKICPSCEGARLKNESLHFLIANKNISELARFDITTLGEWFSNLEERLTDKQLIIAAEILKEIRKRIGFLLDVGLDYLTLDRSLKTLSGGEAQRIRLATQIGTQLVGVTYIMDEPSIGLHQRDNVKLIKALQDLRDIGNTVLVVEHDKDMMLAADYLLDIGPGAGRHGGEVVSQGTPAEALKADTITANYLSNKTQIAVPEKRREGNGNFIELKGANGNNLKNQNLKLPLGQFICVTGVSGSGKSTLIHDTLHPILAKEFYNSKKEPLEYKSIDGLKEIDKVIEVDQSPIGRTPRSNPATYTGVFSDIRTLYTQLPEAKIRGYKPGRFSFNVKGGRCESCEGAGLKVIEMDFLPSVHVPCEICKGKRYNRETLEVRFKGKSISDVLEMTVNRAVEFFDNQPRILRRIQTLQDVGLGYITLGQHATTVSGGEAQRIKLATELSKRDTGKTFYILDEPTTGLHFKDIQLLLDVLNKLVDKGNTVLVIEHNMDIIKMSDFIVDVGPEGGNDGGEIILQGTPEKVAKSTVGYTAKFLKMELS
jgi:excinuclease ABC subunit A